MSNHSEITKAELQTILKGTRLINFDPVKEAFKLYDPRGTGFLDKVQLFRFFQVLGFGEVSDEDIEAIVSILDVDGDGKIGLEDFRNAINHRHDADDNKH